MVERVLQPQPLIEVCLRRFDIGADRPVMRAQVVVERDGVGLATVLVRS